MKSMDFQDSKLKLVKALLLSSFHEIEAHMVSRIFITVIIEN